MYCTLLWWVEDSFLPSTTTLWHICTSGIARVGVETNFQYNHSILTVHKQYIIIYLSVCSIYRDRMTTDFDTFRMINSTRILKIIFAIGIWLFIIISLLKLHGHSTIIREYFVANSTTTDSHFTPDVLIDSRTGNCVSFSAFRTSYVMFVFAIRICVDLFFDISR